MSSALRLTAAVALLSLSACAAVLDDVAPAPPRPAAPTIVIRPAPVRVRPPVEVTEAEFRAAMAKLVPMVRLPAPSGRLVRRSQVLPAVWVPPAQNTAAQLIETEHYKDWCGWRHQQRGDCLHVLHGGSILDEDARYKISFDMALGAEWDGFTHELRGMVDIDTLRMVLLSAVMTYVLLIVVPEPFSKVAAVALTMAATAYLGAQTLWNIVNGWLQMVAEAKAAHTFVELRAAGERYGQILGAQVARVLVMLVTAAISEGGLLQHLERLPGYARASSALAADTGGLRLAAVGQVRSVTVAAGQVTAELAPAIQEAVQATSMAMAAAKPRGGVQSGKAKPAAPERKEPGEWKKAKSPARGRAAAYQQQISKHSPAEGYVVNGVEFDGYEAGENTLVKAQPPEEMLLDAKGKGYAKFFQDDLSPEDWFEGTGAKKLVEQARRQLDAANGVKIRWHVAEKRAAAAIRKLLSGKRVVGIEIVHTPMQ